MFTDNDLAVVACEMSLLSYCLHFHIGRRECPCSRRRLNVPKLLSIICTFSEKSLILYIILAILLSDNIEYRKYRHFQFLHFQKKT